MRGGLERWKRGVESRGVRQAIGYAFEGTCDAHLQHSPGVDALEAYSAASDTADASVVGPDVDAAGLYVGLTRGRVHNVAIVVARTDAAARECLAESMQRGTPELTVQDAVRAAQAEVRRAARNREAAMATGPVVGAPSAGLGIGL